MSLPATVPQIATELEYSKVVKPPVHAEQAVLFVK